MPFAPTILNERVDDYLVNPKGLPSPYMMLTFRTRPKQRDDLIAAALPHDGTVRAQILERPQNPEYYDLIAEPMVCSAADAFSTYERSGLRHLVLGHWLISKR